MDVNTKILLLMDERGWTPYRLAKESGLSEATVANLFKRGTCPSIITLKAICSAFHMSLAQFFAEGDLVELTPEGKALFHAWNGLTIGQKTALNAFLLAMTQTRKRGGGRHDT